MSAKAYEALSKSSEESTAPQTAQSQEQQNDEEKERKRRLRGSLIKFGALAVFAFIVWIFATIAWFSSNSSVSGNGMGVSVAPPPFELEVRGNYIENNDDEEFSMADNEYSEGVDMQSLDAFQTSGQYSKIIWRKAGNTADDVHYSDGLVPNSHGKLTFWVVPNITGTLDIDFSFNIRGFIGDFTAPDDPDGNPELTDLYEIDDDLTVASSNGILQGSDDLADKKLALEYIQGHILFFSNYESTTGYYSGFLGTARSIRFGDCINSSGSKYNAGNAVSVTSGQKYPITIYWKWANTFEQMVYDANSPKKDNPLFAPSPNDDRTAVFTYLNTTKNSSEMTNKVFKGLSNSEITSALSNVQNNTNIDAATRTLTDAYNNADSFIGNNIDYVLIEMTASIS